MKKVLVIAFVILTSFSLHKYYVSVTEIVFNKKTEQLEISLKVFNDDWQNALDHKLGKPVLLGSRNEYEKMDSLVESYINDNFYVKVNSKQKHLNIIGSEMEGEATWIYIYVDVKEKIESIEIKNSLLTEMFDEQRNVVQLNLGKVTRSTLLTRSRSSRLFKF
jgi:hypothetical protein